MSVSPQTGTGERQLFRWLVIAFAIQVAGRLLDFWWHATHDEFETGGEQIQAHWLVWLGTILVLAVCVVAVRTTGSTTEKRGYWAAIVANSLYVPIAIAHFVQHLNREEVDWAHVGLGVTNVVAFAGVLVVIAAWMRRHRRVIA